MVDKFYQAVITNWHTMMNIMVLIKFLMNNMLPQRVNTLCHTETDRVLGTNDKDNHHLLLTIPHNVKAQVAKQVSSKRPPRASLLATFRNHVLIEMEEYCRSSNFYMHSLTISPRF